MSYKVRCTTVCNRCGKEGPSIISDATKIPRLLLAKLSSDNGFQLHQGNFVCNTCWDFYNKGGVGSKKQLGNNEKRIKIGMVGELGATKPKR